MKKRYVLILIVLLTIGFASISTTLMLNGKVDVSLLENDLEVVFKEVLLNGTTIDNTFIIENGKSFIYTINDLNKVNDISKIDYVVMNKSHQYDVEVKVSCINDYEDKISYEGVFDNNKLPLEKGILIEAGEVKLGNIITKLISDTNNSSLALKCTLEYVPISRENVASEEEYIVTFNTDSELSADSVKVKYYEEYGKLPELKRSSYAFLGWYDEKDNKIENTSLVKIKGNHTLKAKWQRTCEYDPGKTWEFNYTGAEQTFMVPCDGEYKIEAWGASGGIFYDYSGNGAYTSGKINLSKSNSIYVQVGSAGGIGTANIGGLGGYNGGAKAQDSYNTGTGNSIGGGGGGATDIRLVNGTWNDFNSLKSRIMVAAGGGGSGYHGKGGDGGTLTGFNGSGLSGSQGLAGYGYGGYQNFGGSCLINSYSMGENCTGSFGYANTTFYYSINFVNPGSGGGGGYYGGGSSSTGISGFAGGSGGGGSSFISGYAGCNAIAESSTSSNIIHTNQPNHYSGLVFYDTVMIAGNASMPNHAGTGSMIGNSGNGYAKITYLG